MSNWTIQQQIIEEIRTIGETTLINDDSYLPWTREWLNKNNHPFTERTDGISTILKVASTSKLKKKKKERKRERRQ